MVFNTKSFGVFNFDNVNRWGKGKCTITFDTGKCKHQLRGRSLCKCGAKVVKTETCVVNDMTFTSRKVFLGRNFWLIELSDKSMRLVVDKDIPVEIIK